MHNCQGWVNRPETETPSSGNPARLVQVTKATAPLHSTPAHLTCLLKTLGGMSYLLSLDHHWSPCGHAQSSPNMTFQPHPYYSLAWPLGSSHTCHLQVPGFLPPQGFAHAMPSACNSLSLVSPTSALPFV